MIHYIPGCDVRKNHLKAIEKIEQYMISKGAIIDACCRTNEKLLNPEDLMVTNCTMCQIVMDETHPNNKNMSLYEFVCQDTSFPWTNHQGEIVVLQDCWRTRNYKNMLEAIRSCLKKMNYTIVEMPENKENTSFDGVWKNNAIPDILFDIAPVTFKKIQKEDIHLLTPVQQKESMENWIQQYNENTVVVYCNGCEKGLKLGGIAPIHLVELIAQGL